jgi:hypothetical protein
MAATLPLNSNHTITKLFILLLCPDYDERLRFITAHAKRILAIWGLPLGDTFVIEALFQRDVFDITDGAKHLGCFTHEPLGARKRRVSRLNGPAEEFHGNDCRHKNKTKLKKASPIQSAH